MAVSQRWTFFFFISIYSDNSLCRERWKIKREGGGEVAEGREWGEGGWGRLEGSEFWKFKFKNIDYILSHNIYARGINKLGQ